MRLLAFVSCRRILPVCVLLSLTVQAWATDTPMDRATLKGITEVQVVVEPIVPEIERHGLTHSQIQADLELRLKQSGINVVSSSPASLRVDIQLTRVMVFRVYAYSLKVAIHQPVRLDRAPRISHVSAPTWSVDDSGTIGTQRVRELRSRVTEIVNRFITAYREQNPMQ